MNYINGKFVSAVSGSTFQNVNPADKNDLIGQFPRSGAEDVKAATQAAKAVLPEWQKITPPKRADYIFKAAQLLLERKQEIAQVIASEMGKPMPACEGDVQSAADMAFYAAGEGRRMYGQTTFSALNNRWALTRRVPVGVCALVTPWNAPVAAIAWKLFPALICGNSVVVKPAEDTPLSAQKLFEVLDSAGFPAGVANLVQGFGEEAGEALINNPDINLISFTGSTEVGRHLNEVGSKRLIKVSLEMGGKNAVLITASADLDLGVEAVVAGAFSMAGQRCASTSRAIIHSSVYDAFMEKLLAKAKEVKTGPVTDSASYNTPIINQKQLDKVSAYVEEAKSNGAQILLGGRILTEGELGKGFYYAPTIISNIKAEDKIFQEEVFGPVLVVVKYDSADEGVNLMNGVKYGLIGSVFAKDSAMGLQLIDRVKAGVVYLNAPTFGSEVHLPFGGFGISGNGHREAGHGGLDVFSNWQTVYLDYSGQAQNSQTGKK